MKTVPFFMLAILFFALSCKNSPKQVPDAEPITEKVLGYTVNINGMTCSGCEQTVENAVKSLSGVISISASHEYGQATVEFNPNMVDTTKIRSIINESGYKTMSFNPANIN